MKIVFMGSDPIALPLLDFLHTEAPADCRLVSVFTQPDRKTGRGMHLQANPVKVWAIEQGIEVRQPLKCGQSEADYLSEQAVDLLLVMAYGQILPQSVIGAPRLDTVNLHASLLPRLRGASPIHTAVALGHRETGVTLMRIIPKLDAGPAADRETVAVGPGDTTAEVHAKLARASVPLMKRTLPLLANGELSFIEQDEQEVSYCRIIEKTDSHLDFYSPAESLANRIRAFQPWPGSSFPYGDQEIRIIEAAAECFVGDQAPEPGTIIGNGDSGIVIACGMGCLRLITLQRPGGRPLSTDAFLRGFPMPVGSIIESRPMRPLEAPEPFPYKRK